MKPEDSTQIFTTSEQNRQVDPRINTGNKNMVPIKNPMIQDNISSEENNMLNKYKLTSNNETTSNYVKSEGESINITEMAQQMQSGRKTTASHQQR